MNTFYIQRGNLILYLDGSCILHNKDLSVFASFIQINQNSKLGIKCEFTKLALGLYVTPWAFRASVLKWNSTQGSEPDSTHSIILKKDKKWERG